MIVIISIIAVVIALSTVIIVVKKNRKKKMNQYARTACIADCPSCKNHCGSYDEKWSFDASIGYTKANHLFDDEEIPDTKSMYNWTNADLLVQLAIAFSVFKRFLLKCRSLT